jgi:hypothetical protein
MALTTTVGSGSQTKFWTDRWLNGKSIELLAPHLFACVPKRRAKNRMVDDALRDNTWVHDIQGHHTVAILAEYLKIWEMVQEVVLQPEVTDKHKWKFEASGDFSTKSVYMAFFNGAIFIGGCTRGAGVAAAPLLGSNFFNTFSFFSKRLHIFGIFLCLFYESLPLNTLNQY